MEEPEAIVAVLEEYFSTEQDYQGKHVLLTAGPTYEPIDPVRFIGNHSTGKMGIALANEFARRGAEVTLILGPSSLRPREEVRVLPVMTAEEMLRVAEDNIGEADIAIFAAAVADYRPLHSSDEKLKREEKGARTRSQSRYSCYARLLEATQPILCRLCPREQCGL